MAMQLLRQLLFSYHVRKIHFHPSPQWAPKYNFAESTKTVLANCSTKGRVLICVVKSHIRKQSSESLSSYYLRIFPFSQWAPMGSEISLCRFHEKSVSTLLTASWELSCNSVRWIHRSQRSFSESSLTFWTDDISFISLGLNANQSSPSQVPQRHC